MTPSGWIQDLSCLKGQACQKGLFSYTAVRLHKSKKERIKQVMDIRTIVKMSLDPKHIIENAARNEAILKNYF